MQPVIGYEMNVKVPEEWENMSKGDVWKRMAAKVLTQVGLIVQKSIINELNHSQFKNATGNIQNSIKFLVDGPKNKVIVFSDKDIAPYAVFQERGVRRHQMTYLVKATRAIPLQLEAIKGTMFRKATQKSMDEGKWMHPGYPGKMFFKMGILMAGVEINKRLKGLVFKVQFNDESKGD